MFAACFGRKHIGAISSFNRSVQIIGTSVGPVSLALVRDAFGAGALEPQRFVAFNLNFSPLFFLQHLACFDSHASCSESKAKRSVADTLRRLNLVFMIPSLVLALVSLRHTKHSSFPV